MSATLHVLCCFAFLFAGRLAAGQETDLSNVGFLIAPRPQPHNQRDQRSTTTTTVRTNHELHDTNYLDHSSHVHSNANNTISATTTPCLSRLIVVDFDSQGPVGGCLSIGIWSATQGMKAELSGKGSSFLVVLVAASAVCCLAGAKFIKPGLFLCAFLVSYYGGMCLAFILQDWFKFDICTVPLIIAIFLGIIAGIVAIYAEHWGVFLLGGAIGFVVAVMAKQIIVAFIVHIDLQNHTISTLLNWYVLIAMVVAILCGKWLTKYEAKLELVGTAVVGAWGLSISLMPVLAFWGMNVPGWSSFFTFVVCLVAGLLVQLYVLK